MWQSVLKAFRHVTTLLAMVGSSSTSPREDMVSGSVCLTVFGYAPRCHMRVVPTFTTQAEVLFNILTIGPDAEPQAQ
jgi:hypothetical protein